MAKRPYSEGSANLTIRQGSFLEIDGIRTHYHDEGNGLPLVLLHGSGPGVSAWENWGNVIPHLAKNYRVIALDMAGFGLTECESEPSLNMKMWVGQLLGFLEALNVGPAVLVGNSFGGALSLAAALRQPEAVLGLVLMGTPAGQFEQTNALSEGAAFEPSLESMQAILERFPYDASVVTEAMVQERYQMSLRHPGGAALRALMPQSNDEAPRLVRGVPHEKLATIGQPVLLLHGREDSVIPMDVAVGAARHLPNSELHIFGKCGHWVQLEYPKAFVGLIHEFLNRHSLQEGSGERSCN